MSLQNWCSSKGRRPPGTDRVGEIFRASALSEKDWLSNSGQAVVQQIALAENERAQLEKALQRGDAEEERIAVHPQTRAAVESARADLNLPQTGERLVQWSEALFRQLSV